MVNPRVLLAVILLPALLWSGPAQAGAWPRGTGNTFIALSYSLSQDRGVFGGSAFDPDGYTSLLIEHGLSNRYTFGLDAGRADNGDYKAVAYLSRSFGRMDARTRFAVHLGAGHARHFGGSDPLVYLGASAGRGIETPWGSGWAALDTAVHYRTGSEAFVVKADATLGINSSDRLKLFVQVQGGMYPGNDPYLRVVPSVAYRITPRQHLELGVSVGVAGDESVGLKLGTWLEF